MKKKFIWGLPICTYLYHELDWRKRVIQVTHCHGPPLHMDYALQRLFSLSVIQVTIEYRQNWNRILYTNEINTLPIFRDKIPVERG